MHCVCADRARGRHTGTARTWRQCAASYGGGGRCRASASGWLRRGEPCGSQSLSGDSALSHSNAWRGDCRRCIGRYRFRTHFRTQGASRHGECAVIWSWTLYRYLAQQFLAGVGTVLSGFIFLAYSIDIVDLLTKTSGKQVPTLSIIGMAALQLPDLGLKLLPFAVLLGGVFAFVRLSRSQELIAVRAAGVSAWNLLAPPLAVAVLLGVVTVTIFTPISSRLLVQYAGLEAKYIRGQASQLAVSRNGLWLRQGDSQRQSVIHALRVADQGVRLEEVIIFLYGEADHFLGRIEAKSATLSTGAWLLKNAWVSGPDGAPRHEELYDLPTTLTPSQIQESFASPDTISFWDLPRFIATAEQAGFSATRYRLYFDSLLVLPAMFAAMVFMAASFSLRLARLGGMGQVVLYSALCGFGVYFFGDLTQALGESGILPPLLAAAAPAATAILLGMTLVFHQEDG
ncbi:MAG: LPS export ABC transporter permease LptG [Alphaproteobacteria bacterium]|nr:LPS export ABC transporter permease LptG [Alphaproteobacteria bacterium]